MLPNDFPTFTPSASVLSTRSDPCPTTSSRLPVAGVQPFGDPLGPAQPLARGALGWVRFGVLGPIQSEQKRIRRDETLGEFFGGGEPPGVHVKEKELGWEVLGGM